MPSLIEAFDTMVAVAVVVVVAIAVAAAADKESGCKWRV
jgi:hypothetical protein